MSTEQDPKSPQPWRATWPWLTALAVGMATVAYVMRPHPVVAHSRPVFAPPAEIVAAMNAQGSTQMPTVAEIKAVDAKPIAPVPAASIATLPRPTTAPPPAAAAAAPSGGGSDDVQPVTFQFLSDFKYDPPGPPPGMEVTSSLDPPKAPPPAQVIPAKILALNGKKVGIQGFMIPLDMDSGKTKQFALVSVIPGCFYCQPPGLNEYVVVTMKDGKAADYPGATPVLVTGKFAVGEVRDGDVVTSLYRMDGETVTEGAVEGPKQQF